MELIESTAAPANWRDRRAGRAAARRSRPNRSRPNPPRNGSPGSTTGRRNRFRRPWPAMGCRCWRGKWAATATRVLPAPQTLPLPGSRWPNACGEWPATSRLARTGLPVVRQTARPAALAAGLHVTRAGETDVELADSPGQSSRPGRGSHARHADRRRRAGDTGRDRPASRRPASFIACSQPRSAACNSSASAILWTHARHDRPPGRCSAPTAGLAHGGLGDGARPAMPAAGHARREPLRGVSRRGSGDARGLQRRADTRTLVPGGRGRNGRCARLAHEIATQQGQQTIETDPLPQFISGADPEVARWRIASHLEQERFPSVFGVNHRDALTGHQHVRSSGRRRGDHRPSTGLEGAILSGSN